jgi:hypothetical protein
MTRRTKRYRFTSKAAKREEEKRKARAIVQAVRSDLRQQPADASWGTSPGALGLVKAQSEEARLATCFECGYSGGRHSRRCSYALAS